MMEVTKNKWRNFKLLWHLLHDYKQTITLWMIVRIVISALVPYSQLLTMAKVIQWLTEGLSLDLFLRNLLIWLSVVIVLTSLEVYLKNKFDYFSESFRLEAMMPILNQQLSLDYPLISGEEGSRKFWDAMMLLDNRGTAIGV